MTSLFARISNPFRTRKALFRGLSQFNTASTAQRFSLTNRRLLITAAGSIVATGTILLYAQSTVFLEAALPKVEHEDVRLDPDTNISFPSTLVIPSKVRLPPYTLLGLGVRTVSFLGLKVYSVAFYADLANPALKIPTEATPEEQINYVISNTSCVLRIVPTRNTSYTHLRDGFLRALQARMTACIKEGSLSGDEAEEAQSPLRKLKSVFPNSPLTKGTPLDIILTAPPKDPKDKRVLVIRDLGAVENDWLARNFVLAYFIGNGISPPMKKSVVAYLNDKKESL